MKNNEKVPVMYMGWLIKKCKAKKKYYADNLATGQSFNPIFKEWNQLKSVIDGCSK